MVKRRLLACLFLSVAVMVAGCGGDAPPSPPPSQTAPSGPTAEQKNAANAEIVRVLSSMKNRHDDVEKFDKYTSWTTDSIQPQTGIHWFATIRDGKLHEYVMFVEFTTSMDWVFWDNLTFSTASDKWKYHIDCFAGQSGNGKSTKIISGGKYEVAAIPIDAIADGLKIITTGENPIVRMSGSKLYDDYHVTKEDIESLKTALYVYEESKITNGAVTMK